MPELFTKSTSAPLSSHGTTRASKSSSEEWKLHGVCRTVDPELWFPESSAGGFRAKRMCRSCPVQMECLEYAMANNEVFGIWGGMTTSERKKMRRMRRKLAEAI